MELILSMDQVTQLHREIAGMTEGLKAIQREVHNGFDGINRQIAEMRREREIDNVKVWEYIIGVEKRVSNNEKAISKQNTVIATIVGLFVTISALLGLYATFTDKFEIAPKSHSIARDE